MKHDTRAPDAHEAQVFGTAYCVGRTNCEVKFQPIGVAGKTIPVMNNRVPVSLAYGSFSRPNVQEVLMTLCLAQSDACDGVTLLRRERGQWKAVYHTEGVTPRDCLTFRRFDRRDQLACRGNEFVMFGVKLHLVTANATHATQKTLLDGELQGCGSNEVIFTHLGSWRKQDVNNDRRPDVVVDVYRYKLQLARSSCPPHEPSHVEGERTERRWAM
ncbi:hypothetical protein [Deinococcus sp. QL22]|uniref:hypothetical protein n=1 Tax=Deinococcus sp. QL22 TaxID=2939437 RepID=UPI0020171536|nr:hypothetical protein [Deinococcus sp. QL22]UQN07927.1 hypothetical protein M1R55_17650 [Deinococcus sp. QL22]